MLPSLTDVQAEKERRRHAPPELDFSRLTSAEASEFGSLLSLLTGERSTIDGVRRLDEGEMRHTRAFLAVSQLQLLTEDERDKLRRRAGLVAVGTPEALEQLKGLPKVTE